MMMNENAKLFRYVSEMNIVKCTLLKNFASTAPICGQIRNHRKYPPWEYHIRFDVSDGRKRPCGDVLDRFKRLNNGLWIRGRPGRYKKVNCLSKIHA